jgi:small GTP-binding protein
MNYFDNTNKTDYIFKILFCGDTQVGKSSIIKQFTENIFNKYNESTIGVDFKTKELDIEDKKIKLYLWDTGGHPKFSSIIQSYCTSIAGAIIVYDISRLSTFENVTKWIKDIKQQNKYEDNHSIPLLLFGNKSDKHSLRQVTTYMGQELAEKEDILFLEGSALNEKNIELIFTKICEQIIEKYINKNIHCRGIKGKGYDEKLFKNQSENSKTEDEDEDKTNVEKIWDKFIFESKKCIIL